MFIVWKNYKHSKLATAISVIGAFTAYGGIALIINDLFVAGLITIAASIAIQFGAKKLAQSKAQKMSGMKAKDQQGN
ncbi:MAG: hypothetical protein J6L62_08240 [Clostridia bacterium]|nr:hypothetical protein [Clostridia bacterium]